jgi:hypothetical protein
MSDECYRARARNEAFSGYGVIRERNEPGRSGTVTPKAILFVPGSIAGISFQFCLFHDVGHKALAEILYDEAGTSRRPRTGDRISSTPRGIE